MRTQERLIGHISPEAMELPPRALVGNISDVSDGNSKGRKTLEVVYFRVVCFE